MTTTLRIDVWSREKVVHRDHQLTYIPVKLFFLKGNLSEQDVEELCHKLLADIVTEEYAVNLPFVYSHIQHSVDVILLPGVTDSVAESLMNAASVLGISLEQAASGTRYCITNDIEQSELDRILGQTLYNPIIQKYSLNAPIATPFVDTLSSENVVEIIALKNEDDEGLMEISHARRLSLDINEMRAVRDYFHEIDRDPTDVELEMLAQTWSEHCVHKTFKAKIDYVGPSRGASVDGIPVEQHIDGLLNTYIRAATEQVNKPWVRSAFVDNAGIIQFDDKYDLAFKVETHNRPSALEPFGGANTGLGGVIRDVLGVSARPIANTDILCFGFPDMGAEKLPEGVLHPERVASGVIAGIEDYGNKMGIPTVNGAVHYHEGYVSNPLVFCGCLGILPHGSHRTATQDGDLIVVIGGHTGRDGLRGATFSSMEMNSTTSVMSGGAVQIGHPIHEKQVLEVILRVRDEELYNAITDCGAGGLSSAVGEMGEKLGARIQLDTVPLKYPGLQPWEIWLSEAQERMVLAVPPQNWTRLQEICAGQDVEAVAIGKFEATGHLSLYYKDALVGDLFMKFLHDGIPQRFMKAEWTPAPAKLADTFSLRNRNMAETLLHLLSMPTIRSKENIIRRYDHEVQGATAVKPLVGITNSGPSDAAVIVPYEVQRTSNRPMKATAISNGLCPQYSDIDPYAMAWAAIDEAMRNLVAVGADPDQVAILDNFSWGNTNLPDRLGALVRCAQGCYDAALAYAVPFVSGKDSLNNEYLGDDGKRHAIPGTLVISALGIVPDVTKTVTMDLKAPGNLLYIVGETAEELGGSHYFLSGDISGGTVPQPKTDTIQIMRGLYRAIRSGLVQSCHDISEGGLAVALAEMCIAGNIGVEVELVNIPGATQFLYDDELIFSESTGRFIVEIYPDDAEAFESIMDDKPYAQIGETDNGDMMCIIGRRNEDIQILIKELTIAWRGDIQNGGHLVPASSVPTLRSGTPHLHTASARVGSPRVIILHANGTNRDRDAALACEIAGGEPEIVHINQVINGEKDLLDYHMVVVPGGFSYGDDLGAGVLWSLDLRERLGGSLQRFIDDGRPVLGICNGFQSLVKAGVLPGDNSKQPKRSVTLTYNAQEKFECRWVYLKPNPASPSLFTQGLESLLYVPVAHGEGRIITSDEETLKQLWADGLAALTYVDDKGNSADYPYNPNGSAYHIAALTNPAGNVLGLMPHPENHIFPWQHPRYHRGVRGMDGLQLFKNGIKFS